MKTEKDIHSHGVKYESRVKTTKNIYLPKNDGRFIPCSRTCLIAGQRVPLTKSVIVSDIESSPAILYCLLLSSKSSTNFAGNHPILYCMFF